jgi:hypothetical protein
VPALRKVVSRVSGCVGVRGLLDRPRDCRGTGERVAEAQSETGKGRPEQELANVEV